MVGRQIWRATEPLHTGSVACSHNRGELHHHGTGTPPLSRCTDEHAVTAPAVAANTSALPARKWLPSHRGREEESSAWLVLVDGEEKDELLWAMK